MGAYQDEQLRILVRNAYQDVPFYRERMQKIRLVPDDVRTRRDLPKLPILSKEDVRENLNYLLSLRADRRKLVFRHTSGTTGKSLQFYTSEDGIAFQWAVWWRHRMRFGLLPSSWHVNFTGQMAVPPGQSRPPYWRFNYPMSQVLINMHHLNSHKIRSIIEFLNSRRFEFYSGYPSVVHAMVLAAREVGLDLVSPPKAVVTGAENVLDFQKKDIASFTGAVLTDQYGMSEGCGNASQCPEFSYHEDFEFGVLEFVDLVTENGRTRGKILCTGFANPEFPFIRYEVGDLAEWETGSGQCQCGRQSSRIDRIVGRLDDYVVTPEGARIMRFDYVFKDSQHVREAQVIQDYLGEVCVRVVRRDAYTMRDEEFIRAEIRRWISPSLLVKFDYVANIERESNGKFRAVKSNLPKQVVNMPTDLPV